MPVSPLLSIAAANVITSGGRTGRSGPMVARAAGHSALVAPKVFWELLDDDAMQ